jgi:hypothetical protein
MADESAPTTDSPKGASGWFFLAEPVEEPIPEEVATPRTGRVWPPSAPIRDVAAENRDWIGTGRVWLLELDCFADGSHAPRGYFGGYWEYPGRLPAEKLDHATAPEAIQWGRARARHVVIRLRDDNTIYSAGVDNPDRTQLPDWPGEPIARERQQNQ